MVHNCNAGRIFKIVLGNHLQKSFFSCERIGFGRDLVKIKATLQVKIVTSGKKDYFYLKLYSVQFRNIDTP